MCLPTITSQLQRTDDHAREAQFGVAEQDIRVICGHLLINRRHDPSPPPLCHSQQKSWQKLNEIRYLFMWSVINHLPLNYIPAIAVNNNCQVKLGWRDTYQHWLILGSFPAFSTFVDKICQNWQHPHTHPISNLKSTILNGTQP